MTDLETLAKTVYGEARGESDMGRLAVAFVCCNRAAIADIYMHTRGHRHPLYGDGTVASACTMPFQFSCWNKGDPNYAKLLELDLASEGAAPCLESARIAIAKSAPDPSNGATHYHTKDKPSWAKKWPPTWAEGHVPTTKLGGHVFYRLG